MESSWRALLPPSTTLTCLFGHAACAHPCPVPRGPRYEEEYGLEYITLRKVSAVVGATLIVVAYLSSRAAGCGRVTSTLCAWLVGVEALVLLQSRLILCDIFLYVTACPVGGPLPQCGLHAGDVHGVCWGLTSHISLWTPACA